MPSFFLNRLLLRAFLFFPNRRLLRAFLFFPDRRLLRAFLFFPDRRLLRAFLFFPSRLLLRPFLFFPDRRLLKVFLFFPEQILPVLFLLRLKNMDLHRALFLRSQFFFLFYGVILPRLGVLRPQLFNLFIQLCRLPGRRLHCFRGIPGILLRLFPCGNLRGIAGL